MTNRTDRPTHAVRLPRPQRRQQLLDVTKRIVGDSGLHAVSIDRVAREAGISRPIVYEHFSDLGGLLSALLDREGQRALDQLTAVMPGEPTEGPVVDVLLAALTGYLQAVQSDPVTWRLVLMPPEGAPEFLHERIEQGRAAVIAQLAKLIEDAFESGDSRIRASEFSPAPQAPSRIRASEFSPAPKAPFSPAPKAPFSPAPKAPSPDPELTAHSMSALSDYWARLLLTDPEHFDLDRVLHHARWALANFAPAD